MTQQTSNELSIAAIVISMLALVGSTTGLAGAAGSAVSHVFGASAAKAHPSKKAKKPAPSIVATARNAQHLNGQTAAGLTDNCNAQSVDLGSWCLESVPFPVPNADAGKNDFFYASQKCASLGGYLPDAAQLIGAANRVELASVIGDSPLTATIDQDPSSGLHDLREMSSTLVTTAAGSDAAGSEGVSPGSTGDPRTGQPAPTPQPAVPEPETLQYVDVYDNFNKGGFAGSQPVDQPQLFRCAWNKQQGPPVDISTNLGG